MVVPRAAYVPLYTKAVWIVSPPLVVHDDMLPDSNPSLKIGVFADVIVGVTVLVEFGMLVSAVVGVLVGVTVGVGVLIATVAVGVSVAGTGVSVGITVDVGVSLEEAVGALVFVAVGV